MISMQLSAVKQISLNCNITVSVKIPTSNNKTTTNLHLMTNWLCLMTTRQDTD